MKFPHQIRLTLRHLQRAVIPVSLLALLCAGTRCLPAQTLKPSAATPSATQSTPAEPQLNVSYVAGRLTVTASNASLNQILRELSRTIGMKLTGGVADERVFGQYGPSTPAVVLAALLDGTGSNMLLVDNAKGPTELILTPRTGGPTPPNPKAAAPEPVEEPAPEAPPPTPSPSEPRITPRRGIGHPRTPGAPPDANSDNSNGSTDQPNGAQSSNGPKSPQQIEDELRQMQQQQTMAAPQ
jgi:hypothetical protein